MSFRIVPLVKGSFPQIALYRPVILIGRHPECDVRIDSPKISRRHCCVAIAYDRVLIRDLGSRNGVRVNGRLLEEATIRSGDELAIGPILFRLEDEALVPPAVVRPVAAPRPAVEIQKGQWQGNVPAPSSHGDSDVDLVPLDDI